MKQLLYGLALSQLVLIATASGQEIKLEYKTRSEPLSYHITQEVVTRSLHDRQQQVKTLGVLCEENVTLGKDKRLVSKESVSYFDDQGKVIDPNERTSTIVAVKKRDTRGNLYPRRRKDEKEPLIWPVLSALRALPIFPSDKIKVGETWIVKVPVHSWLRAFDVVVTSKLESVEDHLGYRCAKVTYKFNGHWDLREDPNTRERAIELNKFGKEEITGSGILYFAYEVGAVIAKEQNLKHTFNEHTKYFTKEGKIAKILVDNDSVFEVKLQMKLQK